MAIRLFTLLTIVLGCSIGFAEDAVEIPLSKIWALRMPGTINIYELEKGTPSNKSLMAEIGAKHGFGSHETKAGPAFAVVGTGLEALKNAHAAITGKQPRPTSLPQVHDISIVFFSITSGHYVHLTKVERDHQTIRIQYEFVSHLTKELTQHFAIIPLGKLGEGDFKVDIVAQGFEEPFQDDPGMRANPDERKLRRASSSFKFEIE